MTTISPPKARHQPQPVLQSQSTTKPETSLPSGDIRAADTSIYALNKLLEASEISYTDYRNMNRLISRMDQAIIEMMQKFTADPLSQQGHASMEETHSQFTLAKQQLQNLQSSQPVEQQQPHIQTQLQLAEFLSDASTILMSSETTAELQTKVAEHDGQWLHTALSLSSPEHEAQLSSSVRQLAAYVQDVETLLPKSLLAIANPESSATTSPSSSFTTTPSVFNAAQQTKLQHVGSNIAQEITTLVQQYESGNVDLAEAPLSLKIFYGLGTTKLQSLSPEILAALVMLLRRTLEEWKKRLKERHDRLGAGKRSDPADKINADTSQNIHTEQNAGPVAAQTANQERVQETAARSRKKREASAVEASASFYAKLTDDISNWYRQEQTVRRRPEKVSELAALHDKHEEAFDAFRDNLYRHKAQLPPEKFAYFQKILHRKPLTQAINFDQSQKIIRPAGQAYAGLYGGFLDKFVYESPVGTPKKPTDQVETEEHRKYKAWQHAQENKWVEPDAEGEYLRLKTSKVEELKRQLDRIIETKTPLFNQDGKLSWHDLQSLAIRTGLMKPEDYRVDPPDDPEDLPSCIELIPGSYRLGPTYSRQHYGPSRPGYRLIADLSIPRKLRRLLDALPPEQWLRTVSKDLDTLLNVGKTLGAPGNVFDSSSLTAFFETMLHEYEAIEKRKESYTLAAAKITDFYQGYLLQVNSTYKITGGSSDKTASYDQKKIAVYVARLQTALENYGNHYFIRGKWVGENQCPRKRGILYPPQDKTIPDSEGLHSGFKGDTRAAVEQFAENLGMDSATRKRCIVPVPGVNDSFVLALDMEPMDKLWHKFNSSKDDYGVPGLLESLKDRADDYAPHWSNIHHKYVIHEIVDHAIDNWAYGKGDNGLAKIIKDAVRPWASQLESGQFNTDYAKLTKTINDAIKPWADKQPVLMNTHEYNAFHTEYDHLTNRINDAVNISSSSLNSLLQRYKQLSNLINDLMKKMTDTMTDVARNFL